MQNEGKKRKFFTRKTTINNEEKEERGADSHHNSSWIPPSVTRVLEEVLQVQSRRFWLRNSRDETPCRLPGMTAKAATVFCFGDFVLLFIESSISYFYIYLSVHMISLIYSLYCFSCIFSSIYQ